VFAPGVTVRDDPHRPHGLRSRPFDGEGLPVSPMALVDDGVLQTWLLDSASARQLGLEPTGHAVRGIGGGPGVGTSNLYLEAGNLPVETLIEDIELGVLVTELIGHGVNGVTGTLQQRNHRLERPGAVPTAGHEDERRHAFLLLPRAAASRHAASILAGRPILASSQAVIWSRPPRCWTWFRRPGWRLSRGSVVSGVRPSCSR